MAASIIPGGNLFRLHRTLTSALQRSFTTTTCLCKGGRRRYKMADSEPLPKKKVASTSTKVTATVLPEELTKLEAAKKKRIDPPLGDEFWQRKPVDDVYVAKYYPPRYYTFSECISMHRQTCCAEMFDNEEGVVTMEMDLCMRTAKKTKFTIRYAGNILLPHKFNSGLAYRRILALSANEQEVEVAKSYGVTLAGGLDMILKIQRDEISLDEEGIDVVICTTDLLQQLLTIKDRLTSFPNKKRSTTGYDMDTMVNLHANGVPYETTSIKDDPTLTKLSVPIGKLNMPLEQLEENWNCWRDSLNSLRPQVSAPVVTQAIMECRPSFERFLLQLNQPITTEEQAAMEAEDDEELEEENEQ